MLHEFQTYYVSAGSRAALSDVMVSETLPLYGRHGIRPIGFWEPLVGSTSRLYGILEWNTLSEREERWTAFRDDPDRSPELKQEGKALLDRTVNEIWEPTSYSGLPGTAHRSESFGLYEYQRHEIVRDIGNYHMSWQAALEIMHKHDIVPVGFWLTMIGNQPSMHYLIPWRDMSDRQVRYQQYMTDPGKKSWQSFTTGGAFTHTAHGEFWTPTSYSKLT